jgi:predicted RNase H-like HicB family nuclease
VPKYSSGMSEPKYYINVFWSDEDECWIADAPDLRPCSAHGDTRIEALTELTVAMEGWLETATDHNMEIPEPRCYPEHKFS